MSGVSKDQRHSKRVNFERAALAYARLLRAVFPLGERSKIPAEPGGRGYLEASTDHETILRWARLYPHANVGIACDTSGLVVLDIDPRAGGDVAFVSLVNELGPLPSTWTADTGGGGTHYAFRAPKSARFRGKLAEGVDIKHKGYIVAPPSIHPSGGVYEWRRSNHPIGHALAELPEAWRGAMIADLSAPPPRPVDMSRQIDNRIERARKWLSHRDPAISGQGGHAHTFLTACSVVRGFDLDEQAALMVLAEWNASCQPPWSEHALRRKINEAIRVGKMEFGALLNARRQT